MNSMVILHSYVSLPEGIFNEGLSPTIVYLIIYQSIYVWEIFVGGIHHELIWVYIIGDIFIFCMRIHQQWRYRWGFTMIFSMGISHQWDTGNHGEMAP